MRSPLRSSRIPASFLPAKKQVVGPFEQQRLARDGDVDRFGEREAGRERERLRSRIGGAQLDDRAAIEIAGDRHPGPALPTPARLLVERDQPVAFDRVRVGDMSALVEPVRSTIRMRVRTGFPRRGR